MSDFPRTDAALAGETDTERIRALYKVSCGLERENAKLREALFATVRQLEHVEGCREAGIDLPKPATLTPDIIAAARRLL